MSRRGTRGRSSSGPALEPHGLPLRTGLRLDDVLARAQPGDALVIDVLDMDRPTARRILAAQPAAAVGDPTVRGIALEIDSFGGDVAGVFDLADAIRATRAAKPVWALIAEHAFPADYALASQADRIILPRTGAVGSIGVVMMHADLSGQLSDAGVTVTLIHSGAHKVDGNPYAPLPDPVRARIQAEINSIRTLFAEIVAAGRGRRPSANAALATAAECYCGADAVAAGRPMKSLTQPPHSRPLPTP